MLQTEGPNTEAHVNFHLSPLLTGEDFTVNVAHVLRNGNQSSEIYKFNLLNNKGSSQSCMIFSKTSGIEEEITWGKM